jgi:hypothetical protein
MGPHAGASMVDARKQQARVPGRLLVERALVPRRSGALS